MNKIKVETWIAWVAGVAVALVSATVFAYSTFETKEHAKEVRDDILRLEAKFDKFVASQPGR